MLGINHAREWQLESSNAAAGLLESSIGYRENFCARRSKLLVLIRQLAEVPAAERSNEAPEEHEDDRSIPAIVA